MPYYHACPDCGANLDPGEKCDCQNNNLHKRKESDENVRNETNNHSSGVIRSN